MDEEKLKEYVKKWNARIEVLKEHCDKLNESELYWLDILDHAMGKFGELTRKQSKTLNDIYERFLNNI